MQYREVVCLLLFLKSTNISASEFYLSRQLFRLCHCHQSYNIRTEQDEERTQCMCHQADRSALSIRGALRETKDADPTLRLRRSLHSSYAFNWLMRRI
jgi:hypothetical protein